MPEHVRRESRYSATEIVRSGGKDTLGLFRPPQWLVNLTNDQLFNLSISSELEGRPDLISTRLYGTSNLYWVLIWINQPLQPLGWPKAGSIIRYPSPSVITSRI